MGKRGPKPLPPHRQRKHRIGVWLNAVELKDLADRLGQPDLVDLVTQGGANARKGEKRASEYMRTMSFGRKVKLSVPSVNREALAVLGRLASNVNQTTKSINSGSLNPDHREVLDGIIGDIAQARAAVLGIRPLEAPAQPDMEEMPLLDLDDFASMFK
ncbi:hypothetical protein ABT392_00460 [Paucibacter sp. JuS9]|uniref:hypothetical protein n=1 Tax=Paucibacter sp. JuS9 TaxID=3228748 RepID=UPI0037567D0F